MKSAVLLAVFCVVVINVAVNAKKSSGYSPPNWKSCAQGPVHVQIATLDVNPNPPVIGQNVTFTATGTSNEQITGGEILVVLTYSQIALVNQTFPLCSTISDFEIKCPVASGPLKFTVNQQIPSALPSGPYEAIIQPTDQNDQEIFCVDVQFNLVN